MSTAYRGREGEIGGKAENWSLQGWPRKQPELDRHFREDSQEKFAGAAMLKHGWYKHIVAFLQVLAQKHSAGVNIGGSSSTLLDVLVVKAEFAVHLHLEIKSNKMPHSIQVIVFVLEDTRSSAFFISGCFLIFLTPSHPNVFTPFATILSSPNAHSYLEELKANDVIVRSSHAVVRTQVLLLQ